MRRYLVFVMLLLLFPVALFRAAAFLVHNRSLFGNRFVYLHYVLSYGRSFGHTVTGIDYIARLYYPNRMSIIYINHNRGNRYVPVMYGREHDIYIHELLRPRTCWMEYRILRFLLQMIEILTNRVSLVTLDDYNNLKMSENRILQGNFTNKVLEPGRDLTGYIRLLREEAGVAPSLPENLAREAEKVIKEKVPAFFERPFVAMLLRKKGSRPGGSDAIRNMENHATCLAAVAFLAERGYNVVGLGETDHGAFKAVKGYYGQDVFGGDPALLNVYFLSECSLFIGQQSGALNLPDAVGRPVLLVNAVMMNLTTFRGGSTILYKNICDIAGRRVVPIDEVGKSDILYCHNLEEQGLKLLDNTSNQIKSSVSYLLSKIEGKKVVPPEGVQVMKYREIPAVNEHMVGWYVEDVEVLKVEPAGLNEC